MSETKRSAEVVMFADRDWRNKPHRHGGLWCWKCNARFVGIWPDNRRVASLECLRCGEFELDEVNSEAAYQNPWLAVWKPNGKVQVLDSL